MKRRSQFSLRFVSRNISSLGQGPLYPIHLLGGTKRWGSARLAQTLLDTLCGKTIRALFLAFSELSGRLELLHKMGLFLQLTHCELFCSTEYPTQEKCPLSTESRSLRTLFAVLQNVTQMDCRLAKSKMLDERHRTEKPDDHC